MVAIVDSFVLAEIPKRQLHVGSVYQLRGTDYITRRGLLANIVGDNFGNGTYTINNIPYSVRKISDVLEFAMVVRECH